MVKKLLQGKYSLNLFGKKYHESETRIADAITRFAGSMLFVYLHVVWFAGWIIFAEKIGDTFPFGLLTMIVSLEAIFLATFIMVSQNRQAEIAEERAEEDDEEQEEIQEDIEEIQEDFDTVQKDLTELRKLITKIEERYSASDFKVEKTHPSQVGVKGKAR